MKKLFILIAVFITQFGYADQCKTPAFILSGIEKGQVYNPVNSSFDKPKRINIIPLSVDKNTCWVRAYIVKKSGGFQGIAWLNIQEFLMLYPVGNVTNKELDKIKIEYGGSPKDRRTAQRIKKLLSQGYTSLGEKNGVKVFINKKEESIQVLCKGGGTSSYSSVYYADRDHFKACNKP